MFQTTVGGWGVHPPTAKQGGGAPWGGGEAAEKNFSPPGGAGADGAGEKFFFRRPEGPPKKFFWAKSPRGDPIFRPLFAFFWQNHPGVSAPPQNFFQNPPQGAPLDPGGEKICQKLTPGWKKILRPLKAAAKFFSDTPGWHTPPLSQNPCPPMI